MVLVVNMGLCRVDNVDFFVLLNVLETLVELGCLVYSFLENKGQLLHLEHHLPVALLDVTDCGTILVQ